MATTVTASRAAESAAPSTSYERFASVCAILAGVVGFVYSVAFVVIRTNDVLTALSLTMLGLLTTVVVVALYERLKSTDASFALFALLLGAVGALGSAIHGGYDLSNALHPPAQANLDLPSQIDPRGLLTFGVAGLGLWVVAWLMLKSQRFPRPLAYLGYVTAGLLIVLYLGRLIVLDAASPLIVVPALLTGFVASPVFYIWLGLSLRRG